MKWKKGQRTSFGYNHIWPDQLLYKVPFKYWWTCLKPIYRHYRDNDLIHKICPNCERRYTQKDFNFCSQSCSYKAKRSSVSHREAETKQKNKSSQKYIENSIVDKDNQRIRSMKKKVVYSVEEERNLKSLSIDDLYVPMQKNKLDVDQESSDGDVWTVVDD